jgi:hypothetical protein
LGWIVAATWFFLALGILARLVRYLVDYPIWHDEAFLAVNLWDRDLVNLLRPLDYGQIAPWLFLVLERTAVKWLGYSELVLRLIPTTCSILSVLLFYSLSGRLLKGQARLLAVAVFAVSFYPIRHGAEIKPYASDLLAALVLLALAVEWVRAQDSSRWWWLLTVIAPFLVALSYPSVFVAGGISLALAPPVIRLRRPPVRLAFLVFNLVLAASFVAIYLSTAVFQDLEMGAYYRWGYWAESFPPLDRPWMLPVWLLDKHTSIMMAYPVGERHGGSLATFLLVLVGCTVLYRTDRKTIVALLLAPFGMGLLAAILGKYPYGGTARTMQYLTPSICLLMGLGLAGLFARIPRVDLRGRSLVGALVCLALLGCWIIGRDIARPYRVPSDQQTRDFARWFWQEKSQGSPLVCVKSDLGISFNQRLWSVGMSAVYLFHQRMYSGRHRRHEPADLDPRSYSAERPLRLVVFDYAPLEGRTLDLCKAGLGPSFELRRTESYVVQPGTPQEDWLRDAYTVLEFVPRTKTPTIVRGKVQETTPRRL